MHRRAFSTLKCTLRPIEPDRPQQLGYMMELLGSELDRRNLELVESLMAVFLRIHKHTHTHTPLSLRAHESKKPKAYQETKTLSFARALSLSLSHLLVSPRTTMRAQMRNQMHQPPVSPPLFQTGLSSSGT